jgi:hypothetical protein
MVGVDLKHCQFDNILGSKMKKILIATAVVSALVSSQAFAENAKPIGIYIGVDAGYAWADTKAPQTAQYLANLTGYTTTYTYDKAAPVGRIFVGYTINENIALEGGYFGTADYTNNYAQARGTASENFSASGFDYSVLLRPTIESGFNNFFARIGGQYSEISSAGSVVYVGTTYSLAATGTANAKGSGVIFGLGYDFALDKNIGGRVGYTRMNSLGGVSGADADVLTVGVKATF